MAELAPAETSDLLWRADAALYAAKCAGRDRTIVDVAAAGAVPARRAS